MTAPNPDDQGLFSRQLTRWQVDFRKRQRVCRGADIAGEDSFDTFVEEKRHYFESAGLSQISRDPNFVEAMRKRWGGGAERPRRRQQESLREVRDGGVTGFAEAARRRVADHGFKLLNLDL